MLEKHLKRQVLPLVTRRRALGALAAAPIPSAAWAQTSGTTTLRVASTANDDVTSLIYGIQSGLFRAAGLDVQFQKANSGSAVAAAVAAEALEIGKSSTIPLINAHARGIPFTTIAADSLHHDHRLESALVVANDGPRTAKELNGKLVSVAALQDTTWLATRAWSDANGGNSETIRFIEVPGSSVLSALAQGRIDAGTMSEPYLTQNVKSGKARLLAPYLDAIAPSWYLSLYFTTIDFAQKNPQVISRFQRVLNQAAVYCNAHKSKTVSMMASVTELDPVILAQVTRADFPTDLNVKYLQPVVNAAAKYKLIDKPFDAHEMLAHL
jgi:NitT/TauT family transport system substrate-binding protein